VARDPFGLVGQVLDGQYRVDRYVGEGGFSVVYRGTHIGLSEPIAIKCLKVPPALGSALVESFIKRFRDESRLHYRLSQGNLHIVRSIASGTTTSPVTSALVPYTVLEWLEGLSLADELFERRGRGLRGRPLPEAVKLLDTAIDALAYAHAQGVVHRDLNPGNIFLAQTPAGAKAKVLDFGVAKILADSALDMQGARTIGNVQMFAPAYGAPEQFDKRVGEVGPWTDVYAVALLVLEVMTDTTVMEEDHVGAFAMRALDPDRRPTPRTLNIEVGDEVENVLARAVAVAPGDRPRDAGELWGMLKHAIRVDSGPPSSQPARSPLGRRFRGPDTRDLDDAWGTTPRSGPRLPSDVSPATLRTDTAALQEATRSAAARMIRFTPRSGVEALAATPFPSNAPLPASLPSPSPSVPAVVEPPPIAAPSFSPPPPYSMGTPITSTLPPETPRPRGAKLALLVVIAAVVGALAAGGWLLWSRTHQAWRTPVTDQVQ
jgi:serine/threonine-protein kinase